MGKDLDFPPDSRKSYLSMINFFSNRLQFNNSKNVQETAILIKREELLRKSRTGHVHQVTGHYVRLRDYLRRVFDVNKTLDAFSVRRKRPDPVVETLYNSTNELIDVMTELIAFFFNKQADMEQILASESSRVTHLLISSFFSFR